MEVYCLNWLAGKAGCKNSFIVREIEEALIALYDVFDERSQVGQMEKYFSSGMSSCHDGKCEYHTDLESSFTMHCALGDVRAISNCVKKVAMDLINPRKEKKEEPLDPAMFDPSKWSKNFSDLKNNGLLESNCDNTSESWG